MVQIRPADTRLHNNVHILLVELDDAVHKCKVYADTSEGSADVSLNRATSGKRNDGNLPLVADVGNTTDMFGTSRIGHSDW
jgi:hypothetical protein